MPPEEAMEKYLDVVTQLYPAWLNGGVVESFFSSLLYFQFIASVSSSGPVYLIFSYRKAEFGVGMMQSPTQEAPWGQFLAHWFMKRNPKMSCKVLFFFLYSDLFYFLFLDLSV